jgi:hypothetical protein
VATDKQLRQTIISTGVVGGCIGFVLLLVSISFYFNQGRLVALGYERVHWIVYVGQGILLLLGSIAFCVLVFGLFPAAIQHVLVRLARSRDGRA